MAQSVETIPMTARKGRAHSPETRAKIGAAHKGRTHGPLSPEHRAKLSEALKGRTLSPEHRAKLSEAGKGREVSPEARAKMSAAMKRRTLSPEARAKMSAAHKGQPLSPEHRAKVSAALKGQPLSPEHRAKVSAALKVRNRSPEHRAKVSAARKGRPLSPETRAKLSAANKGGRFIPRDRVAEVEAILKHHAEGSTRSPTTRQESATLPGPPLSTIRFRPGGPVFIDGRKKPPMRAAAEDVVNALLDAGRDGLGLVQMRLLSTRGGCQRTLKTLKESDPDWDRIIVFPGSAWGRYRILARRAGRRTHRNA